MTEDGEQLLTPAEVGAMFRVDAKTVSRWATAGKLRAVRTPGGHRRFFRADVEALLRDQRAAYRDNVSAELEASRR